MDVDVQWKAQCVQIVMIKSDTEKEKRFAEDCLAHFIIALVLMVL
jgi:hypothetical protein